MKKPGSKTTMTFPELRQRRGELQADLAKAEAILADARQSAVEAKISAKNGFDFSGDVHRKEIDANVIRNAVAKIETMIRDHEANDVAEADRALRAETAAQIEAIAKDFELAAGPFAAAVAEAEQVAKTGEVFFQGIGLFEFLAKAKVEIPGAFEELAAELRAKARAVISGKAPATMPTLAPSLSIVGKAAPVHIFPLVNFTWESRGEHGRSPAHTNAFVPADVAARAVQKGFALHANDPKVSELSKSMVAGWVARFGARYLNLDTDSIDTPPSKLMTIAAPKPTQPAGLPPGLPPLPPGMEVIDRGPPRTVPIAGPSHDK